MAIFTARVDSGTRGRFNGSCHSRSTHVRGHQRPARIRTVSRRPAAAAARSLHRRGSAGRRGDPDGRRLRRWGPRRPRGRDRARSLGPEGQRGGRRSRRRRDRRSGKGGATGRAQSLWSGREPQRLPGTLSGAVAGGLSLPRPGRQGVRLLHDRVEGVEDSDASDHAEPRQLHRVDL
ncbi:MAG TPA: hypothetical protein EYQ27_03850 [Gemmatimonadetes bacterium]|nr:hypothetical protein [Gemmatimonadota bacterium]